MLTLLFVPFTKLFRLIRRAWRLVRGLRAEFLVVAVQTPEAQNAEKQAALLKALVLAADLGVTDVTLEGRDVAETLAAYVSEQHVTHMVIAHPQKGRWEEMRHGSTVNRILRLCRTVDILVVADDSSAL